jgi:cysteine desulfurase
VTSRIYLDYAASTPLRAEVREAMLPFLSGAPYNASAVNAEGRAARAALDRARERVAACLGANPNEIIFTGGGSEADNLAVMGTARALRARSRLIVSTAIEHHAVLHALDALADDGYDAQLCGVTQDGVVDAAEFERMLDGAPVSVASVMYVNNELGTVQPVANLAEAARARGTLFHTDAVQAAAYLPLSVRELRVDLLSLAGHKLYGPKGVGALYVREGTPVIPILHGGSQEFAKRAGTEDLAGIVGFSTAFELATRERETHVHAVRALRDCFETMLLARIPRIRINGAAACRSPHISNVSFEGVESEPLLLRLDLDGLAVSAGSACAAGAVEPSHVIAALALPQEWRAGVVRFSFGWNLTQGEVEHAVDILERAIADLRALSACF